MRPPNLENTRFPNPYHIVAIVTNSDEATGIVETLNLNGFSPDEIGVLTGTEDADKLDAATEECRDKPPLFSSAAAARTALKKSAAA